MAVKIFVCFIAICVSMAVGVKVTCSDSQEGVHNIGDKWDEEVKECLCVNPDTLLPWWDGMSQSDAVKHCLFNGCPSNAERTTVVGAEQTFEYSSYSCTCKAGTPTTLMDTYTLFYGLCSVGSQNFEICFDCN